MSHDGENTMRVDATQNATQSLLQSAATREKFQADFQATLETAKQNLAQTSGSATLVKSTENEGGHVPASQMTPAEYLADYVRKTPEQHMRDAILKEMGLTEEELDAMPPEKRAATEQTITEKIKELLRGQNGNTQIHGQSSVSILSLLT
jgi:hypothetical protein